MTAPPNTLIMVFGPGGSLTRWEGLRRLEREKTLLKGLLSVVPHIIFVSITGERDRQIAGELSDELGGRIDAIALDQPDEEIGEGRPVHERVLARLGGSASVVIQTMQLDDGGISHRLIHPLRRAGVRAALVARGGSIGSRVLASRYGSHSYEAIAAGNREREICKQAQIVVGVSECMIDELCWRYGINPSRTRVIPHVVDQSLEPVDTEQRDQDLLLTVGELTDSGGVETILRAIASLNEETQQRLRLEVIGEGPERSALSALAVELGVRAEFKGRRPHAEVIERMRSCAVFLHASTHRRLSRSVLEAMSHGAPVIVTDTTEYDGFVDNGATGIRVKSTPDAFAFGLANMIEDASWREMIGSSAARVVRYRCGIDRMIDMNRRAFSDALAIAPASISPKARRAG